MKTDKEYINQWLNMSSEDKIKYSDNLYKKYKEYRDLGFEVNFFMSGTFVYDKDGAAIYESRKPIVHFLKVIDVMDKHIK